MYSLSGIIYTAQAYHLWSSSRWKSSHWTRRCWSFELSLMNTSLPPSPFSEARWTGMNLWLPVLAVLASSADPSSFHILIISPHCLLFWPAARGGGGGLSHQAFHSIKYFLFLYKFLSCQRMDFLKLKDRPLCFMLTTNCFFIWSNHSVLKNLNSNSFTISLQ
jgi:hypothetical protein